MIIYVDIDNTICLTEGTNYMYAIPYRDRIEQINALYSKGHEIVYWTARGSGTGRDWYDFTSRQLDSWGVKYSRFMVGKPVYDLFICDKSINKIDSKLSEWLIEEKKSTATNTSTMY
jgi:dTDP-glucose 4,6-dehydratase